MDRQHSLVRMKQQQEIMERRERGETLRHHGVKGMKWGVRRFQPYTKSNKRKGDKGGVFKNMKDSYNKKKNAKAEKKVAAKKAQKAQHKKDAKAHYDKEVGPQGKDSTVDGAGPDLSSKDSTITVEGSKGKTVYNKDGSVKESYPKPPKGRKAKKAFEEKTRVEVQDKWEGKIKKANEDLRKKVDSMSDGDTIPSSMQEAQAKVLDMYGDRAQEMIDRTGDKKGWAPAVKQARKQAKDHREAAEKARKEEAKVKQSDQSSSLQHSMTILENEMEYRRMRNTKVDDL